MPSNAYKAGKNNALVKLGFVPARALGGAALGGLAGYALSPEDRKGTGFLLGAGLTGAGAGFGGKAAPLLHDANSANSRLGRAVMPQFGTGLGALGGLGISQALVGKDSPDTSEDPYRYFSR